MPQFIIVGLAAGLASAALFASATAGGMSGRLFLFFLAPLPSFLAGLGWGPMAAVISAVAAAAGTGLLLSVKAGLMVLLSHGLPAAYLCYLAQLSRAGSGPAAAPANPLNEPKGPPTSGVEWYPVGRLLAAATLIAGALALTSLWQLGTDLDQARAVLKDLLDKVFLKQMPGLKDRKIDEAELNQLTEIALYAFPAAAALSWLGSFLLNLYLAGRITLASGRLPRPWPDLPAMTFPRGFGLLLAICLTITALATGYPALIASAFAGALFLAFVMMGLAVVHELTRGHTARPFILGGVYFALLFLNAWAALLLALLGSFEPILPWRRNRGGGSGPPPTERPPS